MPFKFNPLNGTFDFVNKASSGGVQGPSSSTDKAIARYNGTTGQIIQNSKTLVQDGGAIEAQGFVVNKMITDQIVVHGNQSFITDGFSIEGGDLVIEADGEVVII